MAVSVRSIRPHSPGTRPRRFVELGVGAHYEHSLASSPISLAELDPVVAIGQRSRTSEHEHSPDRGPRRAEHRPAAERLFGSLLSLAFGQFKIYGYLKNCSRIYFGVYFGEKNLNSLSAGEIVLTFSPSGPSALLANGAPLHGWNCWAHRHPHEAPANPWYPRIPVQDCVHSGDVALLPGCVCSAKVFLRRRQRICPFSGRHFGHRGLQRLRNGDAPADQQLAGRLFRPTLLEHVARGESKNGFHQSTLNIHATFSASLRFHGCDDDVRRPYRLRHRIRHGKFLGISPDPKKLGILMVFQERYKMRFLLIVVRPLE